MKHVKFIYSEKAAKFCKISTVDLSYVVPVKSTVETLQNFVTLSKYVNFMKTLPNGTNMQLMHDIPPVIMVANRIHLRPHLSMTYQPTK